MSTNVCVKRGSKEPFESLLLRFRRKVESESVLKDYKCNVMMSREERKKFKEFTSSRRVKKKQKRISTIVK
jgi:ribosomal protein S21